MVNTDLSPMDPAQCKDPDTKGKSKLLLAAYEKAAENQSLAYYKGVLNDHQAALEADQEAEAARDVKKSTKSKRKSLDASALSDDADQMDVDEETVTGKPKSKKRKKETEANDAEDKVSTSLNQ